MAHTIRKMNYIKKNKIFRKCTKKKGTTQRINSNPSMAKKGVH